MRRNAKRDLILDFTSLLDVTLLLLFFFILFSRFEISDAQADAETKVRVAQEEAQQKIASAESMAAEARSSKIKYDELVLENYDLQEKLEHDIKIVNQVTSQEANEIVAFNSGNNLKLLLQNGGSAGGPLVLRVILNREEIGECLVTRDKDSEEDKARDISADKLAGWMAKNELQEDSVIMCDFIYDSGMGRTNKAYEKIMDIIRSVQDEHGYKHFYCSETDISTR